MVHPSRGVLRIARAGPPPLRSDHVLLCFIQFRLSPLHQAALGANVDVVKSLLDHGASVDLADHKGNERSAYLRVIAVQFNLFLNVSFY